MIDDKESLERGIDSLFEDARQKLAIVDENAKELKKNIVVDLAKKLEGKIATETICIEIVTQLQGQVSERFICECLDEKYKQKNRVENAKKQKKKNQEEEKLAAVAPLKQVENEEDEKLKDKEVIVTDIDGRTISYYQNKGDDRPSSTSVDTSSLTEEGFIQPSYKSQKKKEQEKPINRSNPLAITSDVHKTEIAVEAQSSDPSYYNDEEIIFFEFPIDRIELQNHLNSNEKNTDGKIWFNVILDLKTSDIISANIGRQYQLQQRQQQHYSENTDITTRDGSNEL